MTPERRIRRRRSVLFMSALTLADLPTAIMSGPDIICVDLEDSVPHRSKGEARSAALTVLKELSPAVEAELIIRVNSLFSIDGLADVYAFLNGVKGVGGLLLPQIQTPQEIRWAGALLDEANSELDLYAIIETPDAIENCHAIAGAHIRLKALFFGGYDLSAALGCDMAWQSLLYARSRVVLAAASAGIEALDSPFPNIHDLDGLRTAAEQAKSLGMVGKAAKHPNHIPVITDVFTRPRKGV